MIKGLFYILLFYFLGETISSVINGFVPGSVIGMVLLFLCLYLKIIKPEHVKQTATTITKNMAVFFIPAAVGLMAYADLLGDSLLAITVSITASTIITIASVALVQERFEKTKSKQKNNTNG